MDAVHLHLIFNHLPVFGSILGAIVLAQGIWTKNHQTNLAAYSLMVISSFGAIIAYVSGEGAEEAVENIQGISEVMIELHEDFAIYALVSFIILGIASLAGAYFSLKNSRFSGTFAMLILLLSLVSFGFAVRTGFLGGQIRHTEISNEPPAKIKPQKDKHDD